MTRVPATRLLASLALAAAACADQPTAITPAAPRLSTASAPAGRYLLLAKQDFGADLAARVAAVGGTLEQVHGASGVAVVSGADSASLSAIAGVAEVQADAEVSLDAPLAAAEAEATGVGAPVATSQANPATAARYPFQWNMRAIHADAAWAAGKLGSANVTVAILDSGLDYDIPDLNGLVDLSRSASFVPSDDAITTTYFPTRHPINDYNGHGTNVATQVSSKAVALAGVTSRTTLIGVKVLGRTGSGSLGGVLNGVLWAADHGADVANMSLGSSFAKAGNGRLVSLINRVFDYAKRKGMLVVVAAGNDAEDLDHNGNVQNTYCDAVHVLCVAAVGPTVATGSVDAPSYYTNFGRSAIGVAAPGGNAAAPTPQVSAWPWGNDVASWVWSYCPKYLIAGLTPAGVPVLTACSAGNRLSGYIGTSQASPHAAGLAALLVAERGKGQPQQIKNLIQKSAIDLGQPGTDPFYGRGRIDVARALGL